MPEEIDFENWRMSNFKGLVTLILTIGSGHTAYSSTSIPIYQISSESEKLFVDGRTYGRTDGHLTHIIRSTLRSRPKNCAIPWHYRSYSRASQITYQSWVVTGGGFVVFGWTPSQGTLELVLCRKIWTFLVIFHIFALKVFSTFPAEFVDAAVVCKKSPASDLRNWLRGRRLRGNTYPWRIPRLHASPFSTTVPCRPIYLTRQQLFRPMSSIPSRVN